MECNKNDKLYTSCEHYSSSDPQLYKFIKQEEKRQQDTVELIASENITSSEVLECLGSCLTNKYSEGLPGKRYYGGNEYIDEIENLAINRALEAFRLSPEEWGCNVQSYSGSIANIAAYNAILKPLDLIMGLDLASGGHLSHGFFTPKRRVSFSSVLYQSIPYGLDNKGYIDYDTLVENVKKTPPKLIICGASAYPRDYDYIRFREIANSCGAYLMSDISHVSGLIATQQHNNPFPYCDIVTTTTHKTLRGPRSAMIFGRKHLMQAINDSVFPGVQGGPHQHQIAGVATQLREVMTPEFKKYIQQVKKNTQALAERMQKLGYTLVSGGSDNHLILVDLKPQGITGSKVEWLADQFQYTLNKNNVVGDTSAASPGGIRIGTPAMTTRGYLEKDFQQVADTLHSIIQLSIEIQKQVQEDTQSKKVKLVDFQKQFHQNEATYKSKMLSVQ